jgi:type VI secretion system secreted protein VgrG
MASATDTIVSLIKQTNVKRLLKLYFPREDGPESGLLVNHLHAVEKVSGDFVFTVTVISDDPEIELKDVQCKMVCVELLRDDGSKRYFNGYCHEFGLQGIQNGLAVYQMVLKPWLAFFDLRNDHFIFHNKTIEQQTKEIFLDMGISSYEMRIKEADLERTFSMQYDETDYNYLHRRWEEMGWHYWYEHTMSGHKLIISSNSPACDPIDGAPTIPYHHDGGSNKEDKIMDWSATRQVVSGKVALSNYDFKTPTPQRLSETSEMVQGDIHKIEVYEYEGLYGYKEAGHGAKVAKRRMEEIESKGKHFKGGGDSRYIQAGRWFRLTKDHEGQALDGGSKNEFFILTAIHIADNNYLNAGGRHAKYSNTFTCLRRNIPWRPERGMNSVDTRMSGIDTATVVGPKGEEIYTDKYGRIKVQFHWDREGKNDEKSSCWLRVMTPWADSNFGMISLPRIGTEVVIQYLQGSPDRPLVVGQLYNQRHMPPWDLPANQTQSGILSRSSKGGTPANANAFRFEDKKGEEEVWLHAEKDQRIEVEHDESHWVGHDRSKTIDHDETVHVKHDRTETVDNDETITVHNNRTERVDHNEQVSIGDNRTNTIGMNLMETVVMTATQNVGMAKMTNVGGALSINVAMAMNTLVGLSQTAEIIMGKKTDVGQDYVIDVGKNFQLTAGDSIELVVGKSVLKMDKDGHISINGHEIILGTTGDQFYKADGNITSKAKKIMEN